MTNTSTRAYLIKPRSSQNGTTGIVTWIEIFLDKKCSSNQAKANVPLVSSPGSLAVTLPVEPISNTLKNGYYQSDTYYCISD